MENRFEDVKYFIRLLYNGCIMVLKIRGKICLICFILWISRKQKLLKKAKHKENSPSNYAEIMFIKKVIKKDKILLYY